MSRRTYLLPALLLPVAAGAALWLGSRPVPPMRLNLRIHPFVGEEGLRLGDGRYANPGGEGVFTVRDFQFFISNVRLLADASEFREADSYHLARFDGEDATYVIPLEDVPRDAYARIEFGIGVDSAANATFASVGELDPNGRMAWGWDVGYKFVLFEGGLELGDRRIPLVYHVGFDENYIEVRLPIDAASWEREQEQEQATIDICVDLLKMFDGAQTVDMSELSNVKFDRGDARLLASNYARMVSLCPGSP